MDDLIAFMPLPLPDDIGAGLRVIRSARFAAIVSPRTAPMIRLLPRVRLEETLKRQKILESLMQFGTVLPCAPDCGIREDEAIALLEAAEESLETMICDVAGRAQYSLRVEWDEPQVLAKFAQSPEIAPLFTMRASVKQLASAVERLAERLRVQIAELLEPVALDLRDQPRAAGMVAHFAFLVAEGQGAALDQCLEKIDEIWTEGFRLRPIGPSPATCHGLVTVQRAEPKLVAQAAKTLNLNALSATSEDSVLRRMIWNSLADFGADGLDTSGSGYAA